MGFENHSRTGLLERASRIALKYDVVYNAALREFRGDPAKVQKASAALDQWMDREASKVFRAKQEF